MLYLFNKVQVPHYNYVGDSVLGYKAHMGAGSITSNVKSDKKLVVVKSPEGQIETGIKKFGAMLGDEVEVGCGTVLNPGSVVGSHSNIYPLSSDQRIRTCKQYLQKQGEVVEKYKNPHVSNYIKTQKEAVHDCTASFCVFRNIWHAEGSAPKNGRGDRKNKFSVLTIHSVWYCIKNDFSIFKAATV